MIAKVVDSLSSELKTSKWMVVKVLRRLVRQGFYSKLYLNQDNQAKPNAILIDKFFLPDNSTVNEAYYDYQYLIANTIELYFAEYTACLMTLA